MMGVNKASPLLSKDFKVYWWSHLLENLKIPVRPQKEKNYCKPDNRKQNLAILNLKMSTCSIWESFHTTVLQKKPAAREKLDTESMDEWSLERMKEQDPRRERVERSFW